MKNFGLRRKFTAVLAALLAACLFACAWLYIAPETSSRAAITDGARVTMSDMMGRYPIDYVLGPMAEKATTGDNTGKYVDSAGNVVLDRNGNETNNIYGIPKNQYFDVESYIYTTGVKDSDAGRILYGWKPNIIGVSPTNSSIGEDGKIVNGPDSTAGETGIYVSWKDGQYYGTTVKYALIVPKDITSVGTGSGAFVGKDASGKQTTYYSGKAGSTYNDLVTDNDSGIPKANYTDFACFITSEKLNHASAPYFWQPRERLAGIFFTDDSRCTEINDAANSYSIEAETPSVWLSGANRTSIDDIGKAAFLGCDNMRFIVLPTTLTKIGKYAFYSCNKVVDLNIPSNVKSLGSQAFAYMSELLHITIPNITTISKDAFKNCSKLKSIVDIGGKFEGQFSGYYSYVKSKDNYPNNIVYIFGGKPTKNENGTLVNDSGVLGFVFVRNASGKWYASGLAGAMGEDDTKVFVFPSEEDFKKDSNRRTAVKYDYLDCNGEKCFSEFAAGEKVTNYEVADNFANDTWCVNVVMPKEITKIGAKAFYNSHVRYMETYATTIGENAFASGNNATDEQWYYFHGTTNGDDYDVAGNAFVTATGTRHVVFENKTMWENIKLTQHLGIPSNNVTQHYLIPIIADIDNENDEAVTINTDDMDEHFYNDSDYVRNPQVAKGNGQITFTKRLSQNGTNTYDFSCTKQANGRWLKNLDNSDILKTHNNPALSNMTQTVWYSDKYNNKIANVNELYSGKQVTTSSSSITSLTVYTKNIAKPTLTEKEYTFGDRVLNGATVTSNPVPEGSGVIGDNSSIDFYQALGLNDKKIDFAITATNVKNASGADISTMVTSVQNAGTYTLRLGLNADRWGIWSDEFIDDTFSTTVRVNQKNIRVADIDGIPKFIVKGGEALRGNGDTLYRYTDGWYLTRQNNEEPVATSQITNGYTYFVEGTKISVDLDPLHELLTTYKDIIDVTVSTSDAEVSSDYYAVCTFEIKRNDWNNFNYNFDPDNFFAGDTARGITVNLRETQRFRISKHWYVVKQTNMFVDSTVAEVTDRTPQFVLATDADGKAIDEWIYEDSIYIHTPKLAYNNTATGAVQVQPVITIDFTPYGNTQSIRIKAETDSNGLAYYLNPAMPAGAYKVTITGDSVIYDGNTYNSISNEFDITVKPKNMSTDTALAGKLSDIHTALQGQEGYTKNYFPNDGKKLHGDISLTGLLGALNAQLNNSANASTYWAKLPEADRAKYYCTGVDNIVVLYNLEGSGSAEYTNAGYIINSYMTTPNEYKLYYSISVKNYVTVGGADATDRQTKTFTTVIYTDMKVSGLYDYIKDTDVPYLKNVTYTGSEVHTLVENSQYYEALFNDPAGYENVGRYYVTLKLYNPTLARWNDNLTDAQKDENLFEVSGDTLKVYFNIVAANNSWQSQPQLTGWLYNGFDNGTYKVTGMLQFPSKVGASLTVYYRLGTLLENGAYSWIKVGDVIPGLNDVDGDETDDLWFTVDAEGKIIDQSVIDKFNSLDAGTYYLASYVTARSDNNVNAFATKPEQYGKVIIGKAVNTWEKTPNVIRWTWQTYDRTIHLFSAQARFGANGKGLISGESAPAVHFTVLNADYALADEKLKNFGITNGLVSDDVATALRALPAGTYRLVTALESKHNYTAMNAAALTATFANAEDNKKLQSFEFNIGAADNEWTTTPKMITWQYNQFDVASNFVAGVSKYPVSGGTVTYGVYQGSAPEGQVKPVAGQTNLKLLFTTLGASEIATLKGLSILQNQNYVLVAYVDGDGANGAAGNYKPLYYQASFSVVQAGTNPWVTPPSITGWVYGTFDESHITAGVATFGNGTAIEGGEAHPGVKYTLKIKNGAPVEGYNGVNFSTLVAKLKTGKGLPAGDYTLSVATESSVDYVAAERIIGFTVEQAENAWANGTEPNIEGWTYGEIASNPVEVTAEFENAVISYKYYKAELSNGTWIVTNVPVVDSEGKPVKPSTVGDYALIVTAAETANYKVLSKTVFFSITRFTNEWATNQEPENALSWTWGQSGSVLTASNRLINASTKMPADIVYAITNAETGAIVATIPSEGNTEIKIYLEKLGAGKYVITTTAKGDGINYFDISKTTDLTILKADFTFTTEPSCNGWQWGDSAKVFTAPVLGEVYTVDGKQATVEYKIGDGEYVEYSAFLADLRDNDADTYTVTVKVSCANYNDKTFEISVVITPAEFTWTTPVADTSWDWNDKDDSKKSLTEPAVSYKTESVLVKYFIDSKEYTTFDSLKNDLFIADAGKTYTVKVTASINGVNINNFSESSREKTFTVTVNKAKNGWKIPPETTITKVFGDDYTVKIAEPDFGTVQYEGFTGDLQTWINGLDSVETSFTTKVVGNDNYEGIPAVTTIVTVKGLGGDWDNVDELNKYYTTTDTGYELKVTYGDNLGTIKIPQKTPNLVENAVIRYNVEYYRVGSTNVNFSRSYEKDEIDDIVKLFAGYTSNDNLGAGTYIIEASYTHSSQNYAQLHTTITITVGKAEISWETKLNNLNEAYGGFAGVLAPSAGNGHIVKYNVTRVDGKEVENYNGTGSFAGYLNTLNVGTYTIEYEILETNNYTGLAKESVTVVVSQAANTWTANSVLIPTVSFDRGTTETEIRDKFKFPASLRGSVYATIKYEKDSQPVRPLSPGKSVADSFYEYLSSSDRLAGVYAISFIVDEDSNGNYNGLQYDCTLNINKKDNNWKTDKKPFEGTYNWTATDLENEITKFIIPEADRQKYTEDEKDIDLLRFDISEVGKSTIATGLTESEFKTKLLTLQNGTYTVTMRVGGEPNNNDVNRAEIEAYNMDYNIRSHTNTIIISPDNNEFTNSFTNTSWSYDNYEIENISVTMPTAKHGKETVVYTITGTTNGGDAVNETINRAHYDNIEGNADEEAFKAFVNKLKVLHAGTYTVTATVGPTGTYGSATTSAVFTVTRAQNGWVDGKHFSLGAETWIYGDSRNSIEYKALHIEQDKGLTVTVNNEDKTDDYSSYLLSRGAGTYTIVASVPQLDDYEALTETVTLTVVRAENNWVTNGAMGMNETWLWDIASKNTDAQNKQAVGWTSPIPAHGEEVLITVKHGDNITDFTLSLSYTRAGVGGSETVTVNANDEKALINRLRALDVLKDDNGNVLKYTIIAEIPQNDYYKSYTQSGEFTVIQTNNYWITPPTIAGWSYGSGTVYPTSNPNYGNKNDVAYTYAPVIYDGDNKEVKPELLGEYLKNHNINIEWSNGQPIEKGRYYIRGELQGNNNYGDIVGYGVFNIGAGDNDWVEMPGVIEWSWDNFNREINLFRGSARNKGTATFAIMAKNENSSIDGNAFRPINQNDLTATFDVEKIKLLQGFELVTEKDGKVKIVSEEIAKLLNALKPDTYELRVTIAGDRYYDEKSGTTPFVVSPADNSWQTQPNVISFTFSSYQVDGDRKTFTAGVTRYGENNVLYKIEGTRAGSTEKLVFNNEGKGYNAAEIEEIIMGLHAGQYSLQAWAPKGDTYKEFYTKDAPYSVIFNVIPGENAWVWEEGTTAPTSITKLYSELQAFESTSDLFVEFKAMHGDVKYQICDSDFDILKDASGKYTYADLINVLKGLKSGEYNIKAIVEASGDYLELSAYIKLNINRKPSSVVIVEPDPDDPDGQPIETTVINGQWNPNNTVLNDFAIKTEQGEDAKITFIIDSGNEVEGTIEDLQEAVKKLDAGTHVVTLKVKQNNEYEEVTNRFDLNIAPAEDKLVTRDGDVEQEWNIETSFVFATASSARKAKARAAIANVWTWGTEVTWANPRAKFGTTVNVTIIPEDGKSDSLTYSINYSNSTFANELLKINNALSTLGVGTYVFKVSAPAPEDGTRNWTGAEQQTTFEIRKAGNDWDEAPVLKLHDESVTKWTYGSEATAAAEAMHGAVRVEYFVKGSATALSAQPVNAGKYVVKFIVDGTVNYDGLEDSIEFEIIRATSRDFVVAHGTTGWIWHEYDYKVNLFNGVPATQGAVSFTVLLDGKVVSVNGKELTGIALVSAAGVHTGKFDEDIYVPQSIAELIGELTAGNYTLRIDVAATENYQAFSATSPFVVSAAQNSWEVTPRISTWFYGSWDKNNNMPNAVPRFGNPDIVITSQVNNEVYYESVYDEAQGKYIVTNNLDKAPVGWYTMTTFVDAVPGCYNEPLTDRYPFQIFLQGTSEVKNDWNIRAGIASWTASLDIDDINMPEGTPLRGKPYFVFYLRSGNTQGDEIKSTDKVFSIEAGSTYAKDFYIPYEPGTYYMRAYAESYGLDGKIIATDSISSELIPFEIRLRDNFWVVEPRMQTKLYLGDRANWELPTATAFEAGSEYSRQYVNIDTGKVFDNEMPNEKGTYKLIVTATADYCKPLDNKDANFLFTVDYSPNSWIDSPTIKDWSAEVAPNDPIGTAVVGTDKIVYKYAKRGAPIEEATEEKPTEEGLYVMYAVLDLEAEGYESLTYSFEFEITSAFDKDLLIVDIVLGVIAIGLGAAVAVLAIRRYKEC